MLELNGIDVHYSGTQVLWGVDLNVGEGEIVALMGPNGSGKSTILKAAIGLAPNSGGEVRWRGERIDGTVPTHRMPELGIGLVMERRCLFPQMTVMENVRLGAFHRATWASRDRNLDWVLTLFPILKERASIRAGLLSGGEQQMVAIARGLMTGPQLLMMDEPFLGLAPRIVTQIRDVMREINGAGIAVLFNEQNAKLSFGMSDRGYLLESGRIVLEGAGEEMLDHEAVRRVYLGH
ncbi:MAG: ABC transporter ATP-binding protein [Pseudomonadota bacterium]